MNHLGRVVILFTSLLVVAASMSACGDDSDQASGDAPPEFPDDLPVFEGAERTDERADGSELTVTYETQALLQDVVAYYREALDEAPWRLTRLDNEVQRNSALIVFRRVDDTIVATLHLQTDPEQNGTVMVYTLAPIVQARETATTDATPAASPSASSSPKE